MAENLDAESFSSENEPQPKLVAAEIPLIVLIIFLYIILGHKFETYKELNKESNKSTRVEGTPRKKNRTLSEIDLHQADHRLEGFRFNRNGSICAFHESGPAIVLGLAFGLLLGKFTSIDITFDPETFYFFVLPPIIFYQGYSLKKKNFFQYFQYIFLYGIIGTILQFTIITALSYWLTNWSPFLRPGGGGDGGAADGHRAEALSLRESMVISACFSAADEVATLSLIRESEHPGLSAVLFGEGVFNDAMAILLYKSVDQTYGAEAEGGGGGGLDLPALAGRCAFLLAAGLACGAGVALLVSRILKVIPSMRQSPAKQTAVIMLGGYFSFCALEAFGHSGILSVFFCGFTLSHYAWHSLAPEAKTSTKITFDTLSICAEAYCFACIGISIHSLEERDWSLGLILCMLLALLLSRIVVVYGISLVGWLISPSYFTINLKEQSVLVAGGLVRGAISWAQVSQVAGLPHADLIQTTTLGVVMATTLFFGVALPPFIAFLKLDENPAEAEHKSSIENLPEKWVRDFMGLGGPGPDYPVRGRDTLSSYQDGDAVSAGDEAGGGGEGGPLRSAAPSTRRPMVASRWGLRALFGRLDGHYLQPLFGQSRRHEEISRESSFVRGVEVVTSRRGRISSSRSSSRTPRGGGASSSHSRSRSRSSRRQRSRGQRREQQQEGHARAGYGALGEAAAVAGRGGPSPRGGAAGRRQFLGQTPSWPREEGPPWQLAAAAAAAAEPGGGNAREAAGEGGGGIGSGWYRSVALAEELAFFKGSSKDEYEEKK